MAKVQLKSDNINLCGELFSIIQQFDILCIILQFKEENISVR